MPDRYRSLLKVYVTSRMVYLRRRIYGRPLRVSTRYQPSALQHRLPLSEGYLRPVHRRKLLHRKSAALRILWGAITSRDVGLADLDL